MVAGYSTVGDASYCDVITGCSQSLTVKRRNLLYCFPYMTLFQKARSELRTACLICWFRQRNATQYNRNTVIVVKIIRMYLPTAREKFGPYVVTSCNRLSSLCVPEPVGTPQVVLSVNWAQSEHPSPVFAKCGRDLAVMVILGSAFLEKWTRALQKKYCLNVRVLYEQNNRVSF